MHHFIKGVAKATAIVGGLVLIGLIVLSTVSITGRVLSDVIYSDVVTAVLGVGLRELGIGEVRGSYEVLEAGVAFAIFCFFPICQLYGAHATVDVFTAHLSERATRFLKAFWEVVLTAALLLICVQLFGGVQRYHGNGETTLFLQYPLWWSYAASFAASVVACFVALYCAAMRVWEAATSRALLPQA
ncbi:MAG: TRAP transporter small permease [Roseobacter sp.]